MAFRPRSRSASSGRTPASSCSRARTPAPTSIRSEVEPDVILMDIAMPIMDGFQATKQIRKQRPHACILMLTGSNSRTDVDRARAAGAAGYVTKDRIAAELIDAIVEVV